MKSDTRGGAGGWAAPAEGTGAKRAEATLHGTPLYFCIAVASVGTLGSKPYAGTTRVRGVSKVNFDVVSLPHSYPGKR